MIYLDTHLVVWLYAGETERLSQRVRELLNENIPLISPIVLLEIEYLFEIQRLTCNHGTIFSDLNARIGLQICSTPFYQVALQACGVRWTRDPFDRLIVGHAALNNRLLLTRDQTILSQYPQAVWN